MSDETLVSTSGVAEILGLTRSEVKALVKAGRLVPEAVLNPGSRSPWWLWRQSTIERWDASGRRSMPISPALEVVGVSALAERWGVSPAWVKKMRATGRLPEPDWTVSGEAMVWSLESIQRMTPLCGSCDAPADIVETRCLPGLVCEVRCGCGSWTPLVLRVAA